MALATTRERARRESGNPRAGDVVVAAERGISVPSTTHRSARLIGRRGVVVGGLALAGITVAAVPAFAHASFPGYAAFGFAPNTSGGTGAEGSTPPYAANTTVTAYVRAAGEQSADYNGNPDTTVEVRAVVPAGWTNPTCGQALLQVKDGSTNNTNQPGAAVAGWSCEIITSEGHQVVRWWGPQVQAPGTQADGAQFFSFSVTTPSPSVQTTYNGADGTEGFIVDQIYASGAISHWIPSEGYAGSPPPGSETMVASGLARTVAAFDPTTTSTVAPTTTVPDAGVQAAGAVAVSPAFTG